MRSASGAAAYKLLFIGLIFAVLSLCLFFVRGLLENRRAVYGSAVAAIWESTGGPVVIDGPYLEKEGRGAVPSRFAAEITADTQIRTLGIYEAPVMELAAEVEAEFEAEDIKAFLGDPARDKETGHVIMIFRSGFANLFAEPPSILINGEGAAGRPEIIDFAGDAVLLAVPVSLSSAAQDGVRYRGAFTLRCAESAAIVPSGSSSRIRMRGDWPSPGFTGFASIPHTLAMDEGSFDAQWDFPFTSVSAGISENLRFDVLPEARARTAVGFRTAEPVNSYQMIRRSIVYGYLFIFLPFLMLFVFEIFSKAHFHPMHYLLSGAASVLFFLLLLSLSEHIGFVPAYLAASISTAALASFYVGSVSGRFRFGALMLPVFAFMYAYLFFVLASAKYALLAGSVLTFAALACVMILTRHTDWDQYGYGSGAAAE